MATSIVSASAVVAAPAREFAGLRATTSFGKVQNVVSFSVIARCHLLGEGGGRIAGPFLFQTRYCFSRSNVIAVCFSLLSFELFWTILCHVFAM